MSSNTYLAKGAIDSAYSTTGGQSKMGWRGAIEISPGRGVNITTGKRGRYGVESRIAGFAGFNIQRPRDK